MQTIVYKGTSLDGFIGRTDGDFDCLIQLDDEKAIQAYKEFIKRVDTSVIGRGTFERILAFSSWPYEKEAYILSTTLKQLPDTLKDKATFLQMKPRDLLSYLSGQGFPSIYVDGGNVIQGFLKGDLIDDLVISKVPVVIGNGILLIGFLAVDLRFDHIRTEVQTNGLARSYYKREGM
jgi:dihydrofolate reductase